MNTRVNMYGSGEAFQVITTITDTPITLPLMTFRQRYLVTGTGINCTLVLRDARTLAVGTEVAISNASSEFIGVHLSGQAAFSLRVPPRGIARFVLVNNGTQAGTWYSWLDNCESCGGNKVVYGGFEVRATNGGTNAGGYHYIGGAGALSRSTDHNDRAIAATLGFTQTWWYGECGTTNSGFAVVRFGGSTTGAGYTLNDGPYSYAVKISLDTLPTAAEDYNIQNGYSVDANNYMRVSLSRSNPIPENYYLAVAVGGATLAVNTGVAAVARTPTRMVLEKSRSGDRSDLWIDGVWRCTTAGNPGAGLNGGWNLVIAGVATGGASATRGMAASMHRLVHAPANGVL